MKRTLIVIVLVAIAVLPLWYASTRSPKPARQDAALPYDVTSSTNSSAQSTSNTRKKRAEMESVVGEMQAIKLPTTEPIKTSQTSLTSMNMENEINALINRREYEQALRTVEEALAMDLKQDIRERMLVQQGNLLMAMGNKSEAFDIFSFLLSSAYEQEVIQAALPKFYVLATDLGQFSAELKELESYHAAYPDDPRTMMILADLYGYADEHEKESVMRELIAGRNDDVENLRRLISVYMTQKDYPAAANTAGRLAEVDSDHAAQYLVKKAYLELKGGEVSAAEKTWYQASINPSADAQVLLRIGKLYDEMGDYERSLDMFESAAVKAVHLFRQQRCKLEAARMRIKLGLEDEETHRFLEDMSREAAALGVRKDAKDLLKQLNRK